MYRRVLPLLLTAVLLLSGCAAGQKNMPQKTDEKEMTGQPLICPVKEACIWIPRKMSYIWRAAASGAWNS